MERFLIKSKKQMLLVIGVFTLVMLVGTVTYAFFNYTRTGASNTIRVGRIAFNTNQTQTINLTNAFPITVTKDSNGHITNEAGFDTFEITITGDTDYSGGVEYLVSTANTNITTSGGKQVPVSIDVIANNLGTENSNYFTARDSATSSMYKRLIGGTIVGDQMVLVGYIVPNDPVGTQAGINGTLTIKAYLDDSLIGISDTYDGTESDNMGTTNAWAEGKTIFTTTEWSNLQLSFQIKVEANEGIWVNGSLEEIMRKENIGIDTENGVDFSKTSDQDGTKGVYMRAGTENTPYPIMYYRGAVENNNVVFNNKCWKAVRTTDTGGVKLIYNGELNAIYGEAPLTESQYTIPSGATNDFTFNQADNSWEITITDNAAKEISFTVPAGDNYKLVQTGTSGSSCGGSFTFYKNGSGVNGGNNGGGRAMNLTHDFGTLLSTDVIKMDYRGSSSSTCEITFKLQMIGPGDLMTENCYGNTGVNTHISITGTNKFAFNTSYNSPTYVGYMYGTVYPNSESNWTSGAKFGSSFTWNGTNYKLVDATAMNPDATHHYSCNSIDADATCTDLRYVYYTYNNNEIKYYITLTGGDGVEEALAKMNTNTNNSNAKTQIDTWYASNMNTVTSKLEDTVWCNDRSMGNGNNNGWIANGGDLNTYLYYGAYQRSNLASNTSTVKNQPSLVCANKNDAFTVSNGNGNQKLIYPVAMLTEDEMVLAGGLAGSSSTFYLNNGTYYWSLSPYFSRPGEDSEFSMENDKIYWNYLIAAYGGLRPSVSLKPGMPVVSGDGSSVNPYKID